MPAVGLDGMFREFVPGPKLSSPATSVGGLLDELEAAYPRLRFKLRDETGAVRRFVKVFVNGHAIDGMAPTTIPLAATDRVDILHSIQGG